MRFSTVILATLAIVGASAQAPPAAAPLAPSPQVCRDLLDMTEPRCGDVMDCIAALEPYCESMPQNLQYRCAASKEFQEGALEKLCTNHGREVEHVINVAGEWKAYVEETLEHNRSMALDLIEAFGGVEEASRTEAKYLNQLLGDNHNLHVNHPNEYVRKNAQAVMDGQEGIQPPAACVNMPKTNPSCEQLQACSKVLGPYCPTLPNPYKKQCKDGNKALKGVIKASCK